MTFLHHPTSTLPLGEAVILKASVSLSTAHLPTYSTPGNGFEGQR